MTIVTTILGRYSEGSKRVVRGKSVVSGGVATEDVVVTGLKRVDFFKITMYGAAQLGSSVNETLPLAGNTVTIFTEGNDRTLYWEATGTKG